MEPDESSQFRVRKSVGRKLTKEDRLRFMEDVRRSFAEQFGEDKLSEFDQDVAAFRKSSEAPSQSNS
jgi:hypothetical protein